MNDANLYWSLPVIVAVAMTCLTGTARAADESVTVTARIYVTPGREAEAEARLLKTMDYARKAEPNSAYRYFHQRRIRPCS